MWIATVADKSKLLMDYSVRSVVVVLEGEIALSTEKVFDINDTNTLKAWDVTVGESGGFKLQAKGGPATLLIGLTAYGEVSVAQVIDDHRGRLKRGLEDDMIGMDSGHLATERKQSWGLGAYHARQARLGEMNVTLLQAAGTGTLAESTHENQWEQIVILRGRGDITIGNARYPAVPGSLFVVPPGTSHTWSGTGEELAALYVLLGREGNRSSPHVGDRRPPGQRKPVKHD